MASNRNPSPSPQPTGFQVDVRIQAADPLHFQIQKQLEQAIRSGQLAPGTRLPTSNEMVRTWRVNLAALQKAMDRLSADGLIERKPGRGTFVRSLTDKAVIGLLVGPHLMAESAHYFRALVATIQKEVGERNWRCLLYDQLTYEDEEAVAESKRRVMHDIDHHRFKGLIFVGCSPVVRKDFLQRSDLPGVIYGYSPSECTVSLDNYRAVYESASWLARQGCRRVVYYRTLSPWSLSTARDREGLLDAAREHGLVEPIDAIHQLRPSQVSRSVSPEKIGYEEMRRLMAGWDRSHTWPDGLIVSDDIMMKGIAYALVERGIRVPQQLRVVCFGAEGIDHLYAVPVARYVHSVQEVARLLISLLWKQIVGEPLSSSPVLVGGNLLPPA